MDFQRLTNLFQGSLDAARTSVPIAFRTTMGMKIKDLPAAASFTFEGACATADSYDISETARYWRVAEKTYSDPRGYFPVTHTESAFACLTRQNRRAGRAS